VAQQFQVPLWAAGDGAWSASIEAFRRGDRTTLAELVRYALTSPEACAHYIGMPGADEAEAVAHFITGTLKPDGRGRKARDAAEHRKCAAISTLRWMRQRRDAMKATRPLPRGWTLRRIEREFSDAVAKLAEQYGVTVETLEAWARPSRGTK